MPRFLFALLALAITGCASRSPTAEKTSPLRPLAAAAPVKFAETRYEVRGYRDPVDPSLRHETHAVYRRTRVPAFASNELETVPRLTYPPSSYAPLTGSDELSAELATQKTVTADLRALHGALVEAEQKLKTQYDALVRQSAETLQLREQLEAERQRVLSTAPSVPVPTAGSVTATSEVKW